MLYTIAAILLIAWLLGDRGDVYDRPHHSRPAGRRPRVVRIGTAGRPPLGGLAALNRAPSTKGAADIVESIIDKYGEDMPEIRNWRWLTP